MCSAQNLPVYPVGPKRTRSYCGLDAIVVGEGSCSSTGESSREITSFLARHTELQDEGP